MCKTSKKFRYVAMKSEMPPHTANTKLTWTFVVFAVNFEFLFFSLFVFLIKFFWNEEEEEDDDDNELFGLLAAN